VPQRASEVGGNLGSTSSGGSGATGTAGLRMAAVLEQLLLVVTDLAGRHLVRVRLVWRLVGRLAAAVDTAGLVLRGATVVADLFWWLRFVWWLQSGLVEHLSRLDW